MSQLSDKLSQEFRLVPLSKGNESIETMLIKLMEYYIQLTESQVEFLHRVQNINTADSFIPLLIKLNGYKLSILFNTPKVFRVNFNYISTNTSSIWENYTIPKGTIFMTNNGVLRTNNDITISRIYASNINFDIDLYAVSEVQLQQSYLNGEDNLQIGSVNCYSESIEVFVNGIKWRKVKSYKETSDRTYTVTLDINRQPLIQFLKDYPQGTVQVYYQEAIPTLDTPNQILPISLGIPNNSFIGSDGVILFEENGIKYPTLNNIKYTLQAYLGNFNSYTKQNIETLCKSVTNVTDARYTHIDERNALITVKLSGGNIYVVTNEINNVLYQFKKESGVDLHITEGSSNYINITIKINGTPLVDLTSYIQDWLQNPILAIGDLYQIVEENISGFSTITLAQIEPFKNNGNIVESSLSILSTNLQEVVDVRAVITSVNTVTFFDYLGNQIGFGYINEITQIYFNDVYIKVLFTKIDLNVAYVGQFNNYTIYPSLLNGSYVELDNICEIRNLIITTI